MKKLFALILAVVMVVALAATPAASADTTVADDPPIHLTVVSAGNTADSAISKGYDKFCELMEEYSGGSITCDCYYGSELGSMQVCLDGVFAGTIDITSCGPSYLAGWSPEIQALELPFVWETVEEARATLDSEIGHKLGWENMEGSGAFVLTYFENGMRQIMNSKKPIITPEDLVGMKMRCAPSQTQLIEWESYGAIPTAIDFTETFTALQNGTADGNANTVVLMNDTKFYEVQKYMTMINCEYAPITVVVSEATWAKLTDAQKEVVMKAAEEARAFERELTDSLIETALQNMINNGVQVTYMDEIDRDAFKAKVQPVYDYFAEQVGSDAILKEIDEFVASLS